VVFVVDKVALGQIFSDYFGFPCQFTFHRLLHTHHHLSSGAGTIGHLVADVPSGLSLTPPQETKKKNYSSVEKKGLTTTIFRYGINLTNFSKYYYEMGFSLLYLG
jgi:hypothetical protein